MTATKIETATQAIRFKPEFADPGDENFLNFIVEDYGDGRFLIGTAIPAIKIVPFVTQTVTAEMFDIVEGN